MSWPVLPKHRNRSPKLSSGPGLKLEATKRNKAWSSLSCSRRRSTGYSARKGSRACTTNFDCASRGARPTPISSTLTFSGAVVAVLVVGAAAPVMGAVVGVDAAAAAPPPPPVPPPTLPLVPRLLLLSASASPSAVGAAADDDDGADPSIQSCADAAAAAASSCCGCDGGGASPSDEAAAAAAASDPSWPSIRSSKLRLTGPPYWSAWRLCVLWCARVLLGEIAMHKLESMRCGGITRQSDHRPHIAVCLLACLWCSSMPSSPQSSSIDESTHRQPPLTPKQAGGSARVQTLQQPLQSKKQQHLSSSSSVTRTRRLPQ